MNCYCEPSIFLLHSYSITYHNKITSMKLNMENGLIVIPKGLKIILKDV